MDSPWLEWTLAWRNFISSARIRTQTQLIRADSTCYVRVLAQGMLLRQDGLLLNESMF